MRARMELPMHLSQTSGLDMGVDLRGAQIGMAEQFLDNPQVRSIRKEVRGERMPQQMRIDRPGQARDSRILLGELPDSLGRECPSAQTEKKM